MTVPLAAGFFDSGVYCGGSDTGRVFQDFRKSVALAMHAEDVAATIGCFRRPCVRAAAARV